MLSPGPMPFKFMLTNIMMETRASPRLSGYSILEVSGPEAAAFLQAQTMNDVVALAPGQWQWNGWLNPKGRVIALFALYKVADEEFLAILPDFPAAELLPRLQRFVFRAKVRLRVADELACSGDFAPMVLQPQAMELDFSGEGGRRRLRLLPATSALLADPDPESDARWYAMDIAHGLPRLPESQREAWTPEMLSLERLSAYSLKKGCYPGQEIVARTHYLGQAKRRLVRLAGTGLQVGLEVRGEFGDGLGSLVCATTDGREGLAVTVAASGPMHLAHAGPINELAILDGLGRAL